MHENDTCPHCSKGALQVVVSQQETYLMCPVCDSTYILEDDSSRQEV